MRSSSQFSTSNKYLNVNNKKKFRLKEIKTWIEHNSQMAIEDLLDLHTDNLNLSL